METTYSEVIPFYDENEQQNRINFEEAIPIGSDFEADVLLIQIGQLEVEKQRIDNLFKKETDHIKGWRDEEITKLDKKCSWLSYTLEVFLIQTEKDRLNLPHGSVSYRKQPFHVEVLDENKLISEGFVRNKASVNKKSILQHFKSTGEIPDGCEIERPDNKLVVKPLLTNKGE